VDIGEDGIFLKHEDTFDDAGEAGTTFKMTNLYNSLRIVAFTGVRFPYIRFDGPNKELIVGLPCSANGFCNRAELQRITHGCTCPLFYVRRFMVQRLHYSHVLQKILWLKDPSPQRSTRLLSDPPVPHYWVL
jgi:hypothetical protein